MTTRYARAGVGGNGVAVFISGLLAAGLAGRDGGDFDDGGMVSKEVLVSKGGAARWGAPATAVGRRSRQSKGTRRYWMDE